MTIKKIKYPRAVNEKDLDTVHEAIAAIVEVLEADGKIMPEAAKIIKKSQ